jgi:hypothetical protein
LVLTGELISQDSPMGGLPPDFFWQAADAIVASLPRATRQTLAGQTHVAGPKAVTRVLERFFRR